MPPKLTARELFLWGAGLAAGHIVLQLLLTFVLRALVPSWGHGGAGDVVLTTLSVVLSGLLQVMLVVGAVMIGGALIVRALGAGAGATPGGEPGGPSLT